MRISAMIGRWSVELVSIFSSSHHRELFLVLCQLEKQTLALDSTTTKCITDIYKRFKMIIFESLLTTFEANEAFFEAAGVVAKNGLSLIPNN